MGFQSTIAMVLLSIAFTITVIGNVLLAAMIVKLKRREEHKAVERKRHFDVLFIALAVGDIVGSCLNYPIFLHSYQLVSEEREISKVFCKIMVSSAVFYLSFVAILTVTMDLHNLVSSIRPFVYFIYLRQKKSKIPFFCVGVSLFVALASLTLSANGFILFKLTPESYLSILTCAPSVFQGNLPSKIYFFIVGHLSFWSRLFIFVVTLCVNIKTKRTQIAQFGRVTGKIGWFGLPAKVWFQLVFKLIYIIFWLPFMVAMTITTCSSYQIHTEVLLTVCYLMFVPGLFGPFVYYVTHEDLRDVFNTTIRSISLPRKGLRDDREFENVEEIGIENL